MTSFMVDAYLGVLPVVRFLPKKINYHRGLTKRIVTSRTAEHVSSLQRDGIVVLPDFLDKGVIDAMSYALPEESSFTVSPEGDKSLFFKGADQISALSPFFRSEHIQEIFQGYIGTDVQPVRRLIEYRKTGGLVMAFDRMFHMDTWKHRVKAFLYLHDVTEDHSPLEYLKGSHRGAWRLPMEARIDASFKQSEAGYANDVESAYLGCYWPHESKQLQNRYGLELLRCTGSAGTLVIFDGRGVHRATELKSPEGRRVLIDYWVRKGHHH